MYQALPPKKLFEALSPLLSKQALTEGEEVFDQIPEEIDSCPVASMHDHVPFAHKRD